MNKTDAAIGLSTALTATGEGIVVIEFINEDKEIRQPSTIPEALDFGTALIQTAVQTHYEARIHAVLTARGWKLQAILDFLSECNVVVINTNNTQQDADFTTT